MRELLAGFVVGLLFVALVWPEIVGEWLQKVDNVRYTNTMCE